MGLGRGLAGLFKKWGKGIGNAADNFWLGADAQKAIREGIEKKFQPRIARAHLAESKRAENIKDLGDKVTQSRQALADAKQAWKDKYDAELAGAKSKKQADIDDYNQQLQGYQDALADAKAGRQSIVDQLRDSEAHYDPSRTIFTDVNTGDKYIFDPFNGVGYRSLNSLTKKERKKFLKNYGNFDNRLINIDTGRVLNPFDESTRNTYKGYSAFDNYYPNRISPQDAVALRDAENQIKQADANLRGWRKQSQPSPWDDNVDLKQFKADFNKNNAKPTSSFNGQNYKSESELDKAYKEALAREKKMQSRDSGIASDYASRRDAEIAQRIQDAKDMNKAKVLLGGTLGAGALYAGARAMYGGDDTDNTDNINNIDNTDYGNPDPKLKAENTPEGKAAIIGKSLIDTDFDPDKADAVATLAAASHDAGVEDSNSIESSDDHIIDDDELYGLLKAMEDPHKADAVANYIYSKHGNESDVQNLGWRGWLNKYYGDVLRSRMGLDPSSYNGMHIAGGL